MEVSQAKDAIRLSGEGSYASLHVYYSYANTEPRYLWESESGEALGARTQHVRDSQESTMDVHE